MRADAPLQQIAAQAIEIEAVIRPEYDPAPRREPDKDALVGIAIEPVVEKPQLDIFLERELVAEMQPRPFDKQSDDGAAAFGRDLPEPVERQRQRRRPRHIDGACDVRLPHGGSRRPTPAAIPVSAAAAPPEILGT